MATDCHSTVSIIIAIHRYRGHDAGTRGPRATFVRATSAFYLDGAYTKLIVTPVAVIIKFESKLMFVCGVHGDDR